VPRCRELRKGYGERPHNGGVLALACPADGQVVWSASHKGVLLWDAACGAFLGALQRGPTRGGGAGGANSPDLVPASGAADNPALRYKVDPCKGLEVDPLTGYIVARPPSGDWPRVAADQEGWAAQTDNNINELMERVSIGGSKVVQGAGKAVKLLGKLLGGGGGDKGSQDIPSAPSTARSSSYSSITLPAAPSAALPGEGWGGKAAGAALLLCTAVLWHCWSAAPLGLLHCALMCYAALKPQHSLCPTTTLPHCSPAPPQTTMPR
jgi:hypothetical protein